METKVFPGLLPLAFNIQEELRREAAGECRSVLVSCGTSAVHIQRCNLTHKCVLLASLLLLLLVISNFQEMDCA